IQDSLLMLPKIGWVIWIVFITGCTYVIVRFLVASYILYHGYKFGKTFKSNFSKKTLDGLVIMMKVLFIQVMLIGFIAIIPIAIGVFSFIFLLAVSQTLLLTCGCILGLYPTIDVCFSLMAIQPYRVAVMRLLTSGK